MSAKLGSFLVSALLAAILLSACAGPPPAVPTGAVQRSGTPAVAGSAVPSAAVRGSQTPTVPLPTPTATITPAATRAAAAPGSSAPAAQSDLLRAVAALGTLPSYEAETQMAISSGSRSQTTRISYRKGAPDKFDLVFEYAESSGLKQSSRLIRLNEVYYLNTSEQSDIWFELSASGNTGIPAGLDTLLPEAYWMLIIQNLESARPNIQQVGSEQMHGQQARRFRATISQKVNLLQSDTLDTTTLDYWLAESGGYPLRIQIEGSGKDSKNAQFQLRLSLDVRNAGKEIAIPQPPAGKIQKLPSR